MPVFDLENEQIDESPHTTEGCELALGWIILLVGSKIKQLIKVVSTS